jgi:Holliday junction resolvasome RuvABC endonuclease subunit
VVVLRVPDRQGEGRPVIVVAFDLSLVSTGVAHADGTTHRITSTLAGPRRLAELRDAVIVCATAPWPDLVVLEGQSFGHNGKGHAELAGLHALVRVALYERSITYVDVPPASLKTIACGKGNASKEDVHQAAITRLGYAGASRDEADALWLRAAALDHYGAPLAELPATHRRAHTKIPWPAVEPLNRPREMAP